MNQNNIEIELKYWVKNSDKFLEWLKSHAVFKYTTKQIDQYFTPQHRNFFAEPIPFEYLRIRQSDDKYSIAYKLFHKDKNGHYSHCDEFETNVDDGNQVNKIFTALNFIPLVEVQKVRSAYDYQNFEIVLDDVKDIGIVCEIEIKSKYTSVEDAQNQIKKLAVRLGLGNDSINEDLKHGYALMIAKQKGIFH